MNKSLSEIIYRQRYFLIPFLIVMITGFSLMLVFSKTELFLLINNKHNPFFDQFFKLNTWLGDGWMTITVVFGMLFFKYRYAVLTALAYAYSSLAVQILKRLFNAPRPVKFFEDIAPIRTIDGYAMHEWNSFPSGHTASAFTLAVVLSYILPYKHSYWILLPLAALTAFSRVYLAQHFMEDIIAGSLIAVIMTFQLIYWLEHTVWYHSKKLDGRLFGKA
jgi:membrane-associated phospholipid phosphatase